MAAFLNGHQTEVIEILNTHSSRGQLRKWILRDSSGEVYYAKSSSHRSKTRYGYECESECIASALANALGANAVQYSLGCLEIAGKAYKVCISKDYGSRYETLSLAQMVPTINKYCGLEKYKAVEPIIAPFKSDLDNMLLIDYLVNNPDRHMNNIELYVNGSTILGIAPLYDMGAGLFSAMSTPAIKMQMTTSPHLGKCKPFFSTFEEQNKLITMPTLNPVNLVDVYKLVNDYLSGERAKLIGKCLKGRLSEFGLLTGK